MTAPIVSNLLQTLALLIAFLIMIRFLGAGRHDITAVFFAFAVACGFLSNIYWLAYDILRPETRMPFAANEIGEWAIFLLLGVAVSTPSALSYARKEIICTALFIIANAALWIAWSGEWVEDILTCGAFGYFLCSLIGRIKHENVLSAAEWRFLGIASLVLIAAQAAIFFVKEPLQKPLDLFCYILMLSMSVYMLIRAVLSIRSGSRQVCICRAFLAFGWFVVTMYMSADVFYIIANLFSTIGWLLMLFAVRKEADL